MSGGYSVKYREERKTMWNDSANAPEAIDIVS